MKTRYIAVALLMCGAASAQQNIPGLATQGATVKQNSAGTTGGYMVFSPITYNPLDSATVCQDIFLNPVNIPIPAVGAPAFGPNDIILWNSPSPMLPTAPTANCLAPGPPLPSQGYEGLNTNGYFLASGLYAYGTAFNTIQTFNGGMVAGSYVAGGAYQIGTVTKCCGTLSVFMYLGGHVDTGHSDGPPASAQLTAGVTGGSSTSLSVNYAGELAVGTVITIEDSLAETVTVSGSYVIGSLTVPLTGAVANTHSSAAPVGWSGGSIAAVTNPFTDFEGLVAGQLYYDDGLHCERVWTGVAWNCMSSAAAGLIKQVQFSAGSGIFAASSNFIYDTVSSILTVRDKNDPVFASGIKSPVFNADITRLSNTPNNTFQNSDGSFFVDYGGNGGFHTAAVGALSGPVTGVGGGLGVADTLLSSTLTNLYVSFDGLTPVVVPAMTATALQVPFVSATGLSLSGSPNFKWDTTTATLTLLSVGGLSGVIAPILNASNTTGDCWIANGGAAHTTCAGAVLGQSATMTTVFNSLADTAGSPATTAAFQTSGGNVKIFGDGHMTLQNATATTVFNSLADTAGSPATTAAFQTSGGNMVIYGDGHATLQGIALTNGITVAGSYGLNGSGVLTVASCTGCGGGGSAAGSSTQVQFNTSGAFAASSNLTYSGGVLTVGTVGVAAPLLNCTATGSSNCVQQSGGTFHITGAGDALFQSSNVTNGSVATVFNCSATGGTNCMQQSSGTFHVTGAGDGLFQSLAVTGGITVDSGAYGLSAAGAAGISSLAVGSVASVDASGNASFNGTVTAFDTLYAQNSLSVTGSVAVSVGILIGAGGFITVGGVPGVACSGSPSGSFATNSAGIVTHC